MNFFLLLRFAPLERLLEGISLCFFSASPVYRFEIKLLMINKDAADGMNEIDS